MARKNIVITIGNYGLIIAVHKGDKIENKIFLKKDDFNDESKKKISEIFSKNKSLPVYILVDTLDQTYKKKRFPAVNFLDLKKMASRALASEGDNDSLKNFMTINKGAIKNLDKKDRHWDCLFISSPQSNEIKNWVSFLIGMPNYLVGIYMLPVESYSLFSLIKKHILSKEVSKKVKSNNDLYCIIMENKVSGIRQIVFSEDSIVFTRVVTYEFSQSDFIEKFEQDIYATFEYLKRIYSDLQIQEINVINIFSKKVNESISRGINKDFNFSFFTPHEISKKIGIESMIPEKSKYCDILISKIFSNSYKRMKFLSPKLKYIDKFFITLQSSYYINLLLAISISALVLFTVVNKNDYGAKIESANIEKFKASKELKAMKLSTLEDPDEKRESVSIAFERVVDFGKIAESLDVFDNDIFKFYSKLGYARKLNLKIKDFSYSLQNFNFDSPSNFTYNYKVMGEIHNDSGDIEDLFREFDSLNIETKKKFENNKVEFSEIPKNIDFSQKYYSFPISFSIKEK